MITAPTEERRLTLLQLQDALAKVLPVKADGTEHRPARRTVYEWMNARENPMPYIPKPGSGKGTGKRTGRWFLLSHVLRWLEDPAAYWAERKKAS